MLPSIAVGRIRFHLTVEATKRYTEEDFTPEALSRRFGIDIDTVDSVGLRTVFDEQGVPTEYTQKCVFIYIVEKNEDATYAAIKKLEKNPDIDSAETVRPSLFPGEIRVSLTAEATKQYTDADFTPAALSKRFGVEVVSVCEMQLLPERDDGWNETGRYYQRFTLVLDLNDEPATKAAAEKLEQHPDIAQASIGYLNDLY